MEAAGRGWILLATSVASPVVVGGAAWLVLVYALLRTERMTASARPLLGVAAVGLPITVLLSALSGETFQRYYVPWLPVLAVLVAYAASRLWAALGDGSRLPLGWAAALTVALAFTLLAIVANEAKDYPGDAQHNQTVSYIQQETTSTQTVLMWGAEAGLNWASDRLSPVRFAYQYPLTTPGYATLEMGAEFIADLERRPPALVIDASPAAAPPPAAVRAIPSIALGADEGRGAFAGVEAIRAFLRERYEPVDVVGPEEWVVYRPRSSTD